MIEYEYRVMVLGRHLSPHDVRRLLTEEADRCQWELERTRVYWGGWRRAWLRRRVIRVPRAVVHAARA